MSVDAVDSAGFAPGPVRRRRRRRLPPIGPYVVFLILVGATVPWRSKNFFDGGLDPVVLIKAALSMVGLGIAVATTVGRPARERQATPLIFLVLYLTCTVIGGWSAGDLIPSMVVAVRVMLLAAAVIVLSRSYDATPMLKSLFAALATFAVVGAVTGLGSLSEGRLSGGIPPLHPNELAATCSLVILWCIWRVSAGEDTWAHLGAAGVALAILLATGSRTSLGAVAVASLYVVLHARAVRLRTLVLALAATPFVFWSITGTSFINTVFTRGETAARIATLSNRTIAWQAALAPKDSPWLQWFGGGLVMKRIAVAGQYWNQQILDSSWISALVQGGVIGAVLCLAWVLHSVVSTWRSPSRVRTLQIAVIMYLLLRSILESGLFDASTAFMVFFTTVMVTPVRHRVPALEPPGAPQSNSRTNQTTVSA